MGTGRVHPKSLVFCLMIGFLAVSVTACSGTAGQGASSQIQPTDVPTGALSETELEAPDIDGDAPDLQTISVRQLKLMMDGPTKPPIFDARSRASYDGSLHHIPER